MKKDLCLLVARNVVRPHRDHPWYDDMYGDAVEGAWRASLNATDDADPFGLMLVGARCGVVDGLRRRLGRVGTAKSRAQKHVRLVPTLDENLAVHEDGLPVGGLAHSLARGDTRLETILALLAEGYTRTEIARSLGLSQGRITQLLRPVQAELSEAA